MPAPRFRLSSLFHIISDIVPVEGELGSQRTYESVHVARYLGLKLDVSF